MDLFRTVNPVHVHFSGDFLASCILHLLLGRAFGGCCTVPPRSSGPELLILTVSKAKPHLGLSTLVGSRP